MASINTSQLVQWLDNYLQASRFKDYCPNGLQVEGTPTVQHIVTGVTASQALLEAAVERGADTVLVHHGWFWKNEDARIRGMKKKRLAFALEHDLNLIAYHLPLDAHPEVGNNTQLALQLGLQQDKDEDGQPIGIGPSGLIQLGYLETPDTLENVAKKLCQQLQRSPLVVGNPQQIIQRVAWCTGGAQGFMTEAIDAGVDLYISGEASEPTYHYALESNTAYIGAGHHATERYGVKALGDKVAAQFGVKVEFIDINNPI
ncbi:Nif3-like dinuclear metal center hexameric protein [Paenalcaligenes sp.]|uniref:Nif3-like dinuclear metal center hexameric protein n=1 Tax=Paenalcaligenes sp. TaxID=1966342 RepID=UPI0026311955|nr:Nif3-like dinuclear metal center hexameric protein [Paenalcaligenes sp.]